MSYIWLAGVVVFAIMEAATVSINFIWFALGSLSAMIAAMCGAQLWLQLVVFVAVTGLALYFTKPLVKKYIQGRHQPTNADRIIGCEGVVLETVNNTENVGQIRVNGQIWSAKSQDNSVIAQGEMVKVVSITGVKAVVNKIN